MRDTVGRGAWRRPRHGPRLAWFAECGALRRTSHDAIDDSLDDSRCLLPFHGELVAVHAMLGNDVSKLVDVEPTKLTTKLPLVASGVDGERDSGVFS